MEKPKINDCPFCRSDFVGVSYMTTECYVKCEMCAAQGSKVEGFSTASVIKAIELWNIVSDCSKNSLSLFSYQKQQHGT